jgi:hypothetical protein
MNKLIKNFDTDTDFQICIFQSQESGRFAVTTYDFFYQKHDDPKWFGTIDEAMLEAKQRVNGYKIRENKKTIRVNEKQLIETINQVLTETVKRNVKTVKITIPNEQILKRINSTPALNRLSRLALKVGANIENVNHTQFADMVRLYPILGVTVEEIKLDEDWKHNTKTAVLAGVLSLSSLFSGLANVNAEVSDNSLSKLTRDVIEFMDVNKNNAEYKKDDALNLGKQILNTQESVYTGVGKSQKSLEDAKKIAANNAINFYKQETGGNQKPTNIKYQHKTTQASDTSKGISQTTYSVLAVLIF